MNETKPEHEDPEGGDELLATLERVRTGKEAKRAKREVDRAVERGVLGVEAAGAISSCLALFEKIDALETSVREGRDPSSVTFGDIFDDEDEF